MGKNRKRYKYNYNSLTFETINITPGKRIFKSLVLIFTIFLACITGYISISSIGSPEESFLKNKSRELNSLIKCINSQLDSVSYVMGDNLFRNDDFYRTILEVDTIPKSVRDAGIGGNKKSEKIANINRAGLILITAQKIDKLYRQIDMQAESYEYLQDKATEKIRRIECIPSILPLSVGDLTFISSYFGIRIDPFFKHQKPHFGLDYVAPVGTKIYTTGDGIVTLSKFSRKGYGNEIIIDHSFGYSTRYAHLNEIFIKEGEKVKRGQLIGTLGNTGRSTGPHLHYEIRYNNKPINPIYYYSDEISDEEYKRMLNISNSR